MLLPLRTRTIEPSAFKITEILPSITMEGVIQAQKTALITGAASGVGFAVAKLCRRKGMHLALLDIDGDNLEKAKTALSNLDASLITESYVIDVADAAAWKEIARQVAATFPAIDLVVLNAGKGYKPEGQDTGRLMPWLDADYWKKVGDAYQRAVMDEADIPRQ